MDSCEYIAGRVCSDMFILSVGCCPTLRDAGRDDVANAMGNCVVELKRGIAAALQAERDRHDQTVNDWRDLTEALGESRDTAKAELEALKARIADDADEWGRQADQAEKLADDCRKTGSQPVHGDEVWERLGLERRDIEGGLRALLEAKS